MPNEDAMNRDEERRQALRLEAMLDMFEEDRGRSAASMEELRELDGRAVCGSIAIKDGSAPEDYRPRPSRGPG